MSLIMSRYTHQHNNRKRRQNDAEIPKIKVFSYQYMVPVRKAS